jgi:acetyl esterase/lipase
MTASIVHRLQHDQEGHPLRAQLLIYPSLDYRMTLPSLDENATGYFLHKDKIAWLFDHYFQHDEDRRAMSPLFMPIDGPMPPTMVITAQFCPLRDEGIAYVNRLVAYGVKCEHSHFDDMVHAFLNLQAVAPVQCDRAYRDMGQFLNRF